MAYGGRAGVGAGPAAMPRTVRSAVGLMYAGAGLTLLNGLYAVTSTDLGPDDGSYVAANVAGTTVIVALWLGMAVANGRRRPWARELSTVLGMVNIGSCSVILLASLSADVDAAWPATTAYGALAGLVLVLLHRPEADRWFAGAGGTAGVGARRGGR